MDRGYRELVKNSKPWLSRVQEKDSSKTLKETLRAIGRKVSSFRFFRLKSYRNVRWGGNLFKLRGRWEERNDASVSNILRVNQRG